MKLRSKTEKQKANNRKIQREREQKQYLKWKRGRERERERAPERRVLILLYEERNWGLEFVLLNWFV